MPACRVLACVLIAGFLLSPLAVKPGRASTARNFSTGNIETHAPQANKPVRRALLVGIEDYEHNPDFQPTRCQDLISRGTASRRKSSTAKGGFISLEGSMNDVCAVRQLLVARYGFELSNIHIVSNQEATHDGILSAFKRYLIDEAAPGDVSFFFYSGHGSQVKNTLGGEPDQLDETLVPIDWHRPITKREEAKDIRDKEIFKLFRDAAKKVTLTALFDSCHSGGVSRGGVNVGERSKTGPAELQFDFAEPPPDKDQQGLSDQESLEKSGVVVISAARDDQEAKEKDYNEQTRGNFTYALLEVLQTPNANNLSVARIFDKLVIQMKSHHDTHDPVIVGSVARRRQTLFGETVDPEKRPEVNVESVDVNGNIFLQGGLALGFHKGSEFVRNSEVSRVVRIRIAEEPDFVKSRAEVVANDPAETRRIIATIKANQAFTLDKWSVAGAPDLIVWMPAAKLSVAQVKSAAGEIEKLGQSDRVQLVSDPTSTLATHFLFHDGENWMLKLPDAQLSLGPLLTAGAVLDKLPKSSEKAKLFASLPPPTELAVQIKLGANTGNNAVGWSKNPQEADYWLVGRHFTDSGGSALEYAWLSPQSTTGVARAANPDAASLKSSNVAVSPLPPITGWRSKAGDLENMALRLSKIRGWTKLDSPQGESGGFAYSLVMKNGAGEVLSGEKATLTEGDIFSISLVADENLRQPPIKQRHVYVLSLDQYGKSELVYPAINNGEGDSAIPFIPDSGKIAPEIPLARIRVCGPDPKKSGCRNPGILGAETYIMLTTTDKLPDPTVLEGDGVRSPEDIARDAKSKGTRGEDSPLGNLLTSIGSTSRGEPVVPLNWSVQQVFLRSVEKKP